MRKDRICLRCSGVFSSPGAHIRICGFCHEDFLQAEWRSVVMGDQHTHLPMNYDRNKGKRVQTRLGGLYE